MPHYSSVEQRQTESIQLQWLFSHFQNSRRIWKHCVAMKLFHFPEISLTQAVPKKPCCKCIHWMSSVQSLWWLASWNLQKNRGLQRLGDLPETKRTLPCKSWLWIRLWDLGGIIWLSLASGALHSSAVDNKTSSLRLLSLRFKFRGLFRSFFHCFCIRMLHQRLMRPSTVSEMPRSYVQHTTQGRNMLTPPMPTSLVSWLLGC